MDTVIRYFFQIFTYILEGFISSIKSRGFNPYIRLQQKYIWLQPFLCFFGILLYDFTKIKNRKMKVTITSSLGHIGKPLA